MGSAFGLVLMLGVWLLPGLHVGTGKHTMPDRLGWALLAALSGPLGRAVFLVVRAWRPAG